MKYRLVTRSDFDGLACAVLLRSIDMIDQIEFVHPKDVQDGKVEITNRDILTNLPYDSRAHLVIDHHLSETVRVKDDPINRIIDPDAPSAARVVYDHFGGRKRFPGISLGLMRAVDQADSADYAMHDIRRPEGWTLLNFLMDSRTGLGRFRDFRISNYDLMMQLIDHCLDHESADEILALPDVAERVALYHEQKPLFTEQLLRVSTISDDVVTVDLRGEDKIHAGNRFLIYALFPQARVSIHVMPGRQDANVVLAVGKSILDRTSPVNIGAVCLRHGGGGHKAAGTCQVPHDDVEATLADIVRSVTGTG